VANNGRQDQKAPFFVTYSRNCFVWLPLSPFVFHMHQVRSPRSCSSIFDCGISDNDKVGPRNAYGKIFDELW
jgi:hypothetical protein